MPDGNNNLQQIYNNLYNSNLFDLPDYDTFAKDMQDVNKRGELYQNLYSSNLFDLPDYDTFSRDLGFNIFQNQKIPQDSIQKIRDAEVKNKNLFPFNLVSVADQMEKRNAFWDTDYNSLDEIDENIFPEYKGYIRAAKERDKQISPNQIDITPEGYVVEEMPSGIISNNEDGKEKVKLFKQKLQWSNLNRKLIDSEEQEARASMDEMRRRELEENKAILAMDVPAIYGNASTAATFPSTASNNMFSIIESRVQNSAAGVALETFEAARDMMNNPSKYDDSSGLKNFGTGAARSIVDFLRTGGGLLEMLKVPAINSLANKIEELEDRHRTNRDYDVTRDLSKDENLLLDSILALQQAEILRSDDLSEAFKGGQIAGDSAVFMAQFFAWSGLAGSLAKKGGRSLAKAIVKRINNKFLRNAANIAGQTAIRLGDAVAMTSIQPQAQKAIWSRQNDFQVMPDAEGNIKYGELNDHDYLGNLWNSALENFTERGGFTKTFRKSIGFDKYFNKTKFGKWLGKMQGTKWGQFLERTGFNGLGEVWEEFEMAVIQNNLDEFFKPENLRTMAMGFLPMQIIGLGGHARNAYNAGRINRKARRSEELFTEELRNRGFGEEEINKIKNEVLSGNGSYLTDEYKKRYAKIASGDIVVGADEQQRLLNRAMEGNEEHYAGELQRGKALAANFALQKAKQVLVDSEEFKKYQAREFENRRRVNTYINSDGNFYEADVQRKGKDGQTETFKGYVIGYKNGVPTDENGQPDYEKMKDWVWVVEPTTNIRALYSKDSLLGVKKIDGRIKLIQDAIEKPFSKEELSEMENSASIFEYIKNHPDKEEDILRYYDGRAYIDILSLGESAEEKIEKEWVKIDFVTNEDGFIYEATAKDGRVMYILSGKYDSENAEGNDLYVFDTSDNRVKRISAAQISDVSDAINPQAEKEKATREIRQDGTEELPADEAALTEEATAVNRMLQEALRQAGEEFDAMAENMSYKGTNEVREVELKGEDGRWYVSDDTSDNDTGALLLNDGYGNKRTVSNDAVNGEARVSTLDEKKAEYVSIRIDEIYEELMERQAAEAAAANETPADTTEAPTETPTEAEVAANEEAAKRQAFYDSLPRDKKGEIDFDAMTTEQQLMYSEYEGGVEFALKAAATSKKAIEEDIEKLNKRIEKEVNPAKAVEVQKKINALQDNIRVIDEYVSGKGAAEAEGNKREIKPVGKGQFGNIYDQFRGKAKEAIAFLMEQKEGEATGVFHRNEIGDIDLPYGKTGENGFGLAHIEERRKETGQNIEELLETLEDVINNGKIIRDTDRVYLQKDGKNAVVRLDYDGKAKNWVVTAYFLNNKLPLEEGGEVTPPSDSRISDVTDNTTPKRQGKGTEKNSDGKKTGKKTKKVKSIYDASVAEKQKIIGEPQSVEEAVALMILDGTKIRWSNRLTQSGTVSSGGLGSHLGYGEKERLRYIQITHNDGFTPEAFAEYIESEDTSGLFANMDTMEILGVVLDVLRVVNSTRAAFEYIYDGRQQRAAAEENYIEGLREQAEQKSQEQELQIIEEGYNEVVEIIDNDMPITNEEYDEINTYNINEYQKNLYNFVEIYEYDDKRREDISLGEESNPRGLDSASAGSNTPNEILGGLGRQQHGDVDQRNVRGEAGHDEVHTPVRSDGNTVSVENNNGIARNASIAREGSQVDSPRLTDTQQQELDKETAEYDGRIAKAEQRLKDAQKDYDETKKKIGESFSAEKQTSLFGDEKKQDDNNKDLLFGDEVKNDFGDANLLRIFEEQKNKLKVAQARWKALRDGRAKFIADKREAILRQREIGASEESPRYQAQAAELEAVNKRFNEELEQQIEGTLPKRHTYKLGNPSPVLQSAGIPNLPIELQASRLSDKSMQENHPFDLSEVKDLPKAIQKPLAVFRSATHIGSYVIMTEIEHNGKNYVVALQANKRKGSIEINDIRSIHYRSSNAHIANWIDEGLLEYADKQKMAEWFSKQRYNSAEVRKLFNRAAKIVQEFKNPKFSVENNLPRPKREDYDTLMEYLQAMAAWRQKRHISDKKIQLITDRAVYDEFIELLKQNGLADNVYGSERLREFLEKHLGKAAAAKFMYGRRRYVGGNSGYVGYSQDKEAEIENSLRFMVEMNSGSVKNRDRKILRTDEQGRNIVWENENYFIAFSHGDRIHYYISLWDKSSGNKVGELYASVENKGVPKDFVSIDNVKIDPNHRGKGLSIEMYQVLIDFTDENIEGIASYLPERINKKQVPRIWRRFGGIVEGDYEQIRFMSTSKGEVYGLTAGRDIYLDDKLMNANTPIHEFGHLWVSFVRENNRELWEKIKELTGNSVYFAEVNQDPNYNTKSEEDRLDEAFVRALGDNGARVFNDPKMGATFKERFKRLMNDFWTWVGQKLGIRDLTAEQISRLTFEQAVKGALADITSGKAIRNAQQANEAAQNYFNTNPDRLPLTLSAFERKEFKAYRGKNIRPNELAGLLNLSGLKAIEKELIRGVVNSKYAGAKTIPYDELEATVRANIIPLDRIESQSYANYGSKNIWNDEPSDSYTLILNMPEVEHGKQGHFSGDFTTRNTRKANYVPKQLDENTWVAVEEGYMNNGANESNIYNFVGTAANSKEKVEQWIKDYNDRMGKDEYTNVGLYGHVRVWVDGEDVYIAELQSDFFQNNPARKTVVESKDEFKDAADEVYKKRNKVVDGIWEETYKQIENTLTEHGYSVAQTSYGVVIVDKSGAIVQRSHNERGLYSHFVDDLNYIDYLEEDARSAFQNIKDVHDGKIKAEDSKVDKQLDKVRNAVYEKLSPAEKQFIASQKAFERRLLHEAVAEAKAKGARTVRFPTPYTLSVIEGYIEKGNPYEIVKQQYPNDNNLSEGDIISMDGHEYIVIGADPSEILVASTRYSESNTKEGFAKEKANRIIYDTLYDLPYFVNREAVEDYNFGHDSLKEKALEIFDREYDGSEDFMLNLADYRDEIEEAVYDEIYDEVYDSYDNKYNIIDELRDEFGYYDAVADNEGNITYWNDAPDTERLRQPGTGATSDKDNFSITDLDGTQQRVVEKYVEYEDTLRQDFGDENVSIVEDGEGNDWVELDLTSAAAQNRPVVAFQSKVEYANQDDYDFDVRGITAANAEEMQGIKEAAQANGTFMKAPNGKESKLNERQWLQVRTEAFKKWFGDWEYLAELKENIAKIDTLLNADKDTSKGKQRETIGKAQAREISVIKDALGIDVSGYNHTIDKSEINHTLRNHGNPKTEANRGQIAITNDDFKLVPAVLANPDKIFYSGKNDKGLETITYEKAINGTIITVEEVRTGGKELAFNTMRKRKRGSGSLLSPSALTSETTSSTAKVHNISELITELEKNVSKVVDENGEPMVVYHKSKNNFTKFDKSKIGTGNGLNALGKGFYFADTKGNLYIPDKFGKENLFGDIVYETFLNIRNPKQTTQWFDGKLSYKFDGVVTKWKDAYSEHKEFMALSPNQIKSATDNNGNFDEKSDDIRFMFIGEQGAAQNNLEYSEKNSIFAEKNQRYGTGKEAGMDNGRAVGGSAIREALGKLSQGNGVFQTLIAGNRRGSTGTAEGSVPQGWDKSRFLAQLEIAALENGTWIDDIGTIADKSKPLKGGFENEPYVSKDGKHVIKINNFAFLNDNDTQYKHTRDFDYFIDRLTAHNELFPDVAYKIIGFTENKMGEVCVVLEQPYVKDAELATQDEINDYLTEIGFTKSDNLTSGLPDGWTNGKYEITDAKPQNVLKDKKGNLRFIDTDINSVYDEASQEEDVRFQVENSGNAPKLEKGKTLLENLETIAAWKAMRAGADAEAGATARRSMKEKIRDLRKKIREQKSDYKDNARAVEAFVKSLIDSQMFSIITVGELKKIHKQIKEVTTNGELELPLLNIAHIASRAQLRAAEATFEKLMKLKLDDKNKKGVRVAKGVDNSTASIIQTAKEYLNDSLEEIINEEQNIEAELEKDITAEERQVYIDKLTGLRIARIYQENVIPAKKRVSEIEREIQNIERGIKSAREEKNGILAKIKELGEQILSEKDAGKRQKLFEQRDELQKLLPASNKRYRDRKKIYDNTLNAEKLTLIEAREETTSAIDNLTTRIEQIIDRGKSGRSGWLEDRRKHKEELLHFAFRDLKGISPKMFEERGETKNVAKKLQNWLVDPLHSIEYELKYLAARNAIDGKGDMYNYFMPKLINAETEKVEGLRAATQMINEKIQSLYGKGMDLFNLYDQMKKRDIEDAVAKIEYYSEGKNQTQELRLTEGNIMLIYIWNKMADGKIKLANMGITDDIVNELAGKVDKRVLELADWIQDELLPLLRTKYNSTHIRVFGIEMDNIDNYFPLKILTGQISKSADIEKEDANAWERGFATTSTGAIIRRVKNKLALDITEDGLGLLIRHINEMENWNAFAETIQDFNTLLSNKTFRNKLEKIHRGEVRRFTEAAQVATNSFRSQTEHEILNKIAKGVATSKISLRVFTAAKQVLSAPAFWTYGSPEYWAIYAKCIVNLQGSWEWAVENLPLLKDRWRTRKAGNEKLSQSMYLDKNKVISNWGMLPNAFVDMLVCAIGARAVYEYEHAKYIKKGYSEEKASDLARIDAEVAYNQSQQSAIGAFLSKVQVSRDFINISRSLFNNSNIAYQRLVASSVRNLRYSLNPEHRRAMIENRAKQLMRDGISEQQAKIIAQRDFRNAMLTDMARIMIFGFGLQVLWILGSNAVSLMLGGDDDEEKVMDYILYTILTDPIRGLTFGGTAEQFAQSMIDARANGFSIASVLNPLTGDAERLINELGAGDMKRILNSLLSLTSSAALGIDTNTIVPLLVTAQNLIDGNVMTASEVILEILRVMNAPRSQIRNIDLSLKANEIPLKGDDVRDENKERFVRYATRAARIFRFNKYGVLGVLGGSVDAGILLRAEKEDDEDKRIKILKEYGVSELEFSQIEREYSRRVLLLENPELAREYDKLNEKLRELKKRPIGEIVSEDELIKQEIEDMARELESINN